MNNNIFIFPGQGSQSTGMGKDFYDNDSLAKEMLERASERLDLDFAHLLFEPNELLEQTQYTQPAILLVSSIAHALFVKHQPKAPIMALGHSLGEFSALVAVGALDFLDAIELSHKRGLFMSEACATIDAGMLAILGLEDEKIEDIAQKQRAKGLQVWPANYNTQGQVVLAGQRDDLKSLESVFKEAGAKRAMLLPMSVASHCPLLESVKDRLFVYLEKYIKDSFSAPIVSNVTAMQYQSKNEAIRLLSDQLTNPVKYKQSISNIDAQADFYVEFGSTVLKGLNKRLSKKPTLCITDMTSLQEALRVLS